MEIQVQNGNKYGLNRRLSEEETAHKAREWDGYTRLPVYVQYQFNNVEEVM